MLKRLFNQILHIGRGSFDVGGEFSIFINILLVVVFYLITMTPLKRFFNLHDLL